MSWCFAFTHDPKKQQQDISSSPAIMTAGGRQLFGFSLVRIMPMVEKQSQQEKLPFHVFSHIG
jgi:hypothetical protein